MREIDLPVSIEEALTRLRAREITASELTDACLRQIARLNPSLNAFITVTADEAREAAGRADDAWSGGRWLGPLHGIPVSLKDLIDQRGVPTTAGSRVVDGVPAPTDAPVTAALRAAGAILIGKCNLHEFAFGTTSDESAFGPVRHPLDVERAAGGSSGGSAVAVSTGMSLASIGTDTGGSIRIPAAACGVVGLKPTTGEISLDGVVPLSRSLDHVGPLARTVADAALTFAVLTGTPQVTANEAPSVRSLRLAVPTGRVFERVQPQVRECFEQACQRLRQAGARLERVEIPGAALAASAYLAIVLSEAAEWHARALEQIPEKYCPGVRIRLEAGRYVLAEDYIRAQRVRIRLRDAIDATLAGCDALLVPGLALTAPAVGAKTAMFEDGEEPVRAAMLRLTQPFNLSGHPSIVMPCDATSDGMPCALQLVGQRHDTRTLLQVALACEPYGTRGGTG